MIFSPHPIHRRRQAGILFSLASHAALLGLAFVLTLHYGRVRPIYHESRCCTAALYWSGNTGTTSSNPQTAQRRTHEKRPATPPPLPPLEKPRLAFRTAQTPDQPTPAKSAQTQQGMVTPQQQSTTGTGAGNENAEPAFPVFYPTPTVSDRSLLPAVEQKIIVDVTVSALGDVMDEKLVQGLGNNLDQTVLTTVKTWRFHPATLNGTAVASVEELVFPFNRDYPSDNS